MNETTYEVSLSEAEIYTLTPQVRANGGGPPEVRYDQENRVWYAPDLEIKNFDTVIRTEDGLEFLLDRTFWRKADLEQADEGTFILIDTDSPDVIAWREGV